jgi:DNA-binding NarL/FixJ family response regulator
MSLSVSSALSTAAVAAANSSSNAAPATRNPQPQPQQATNNPGYTVQLSEAQQVYNLYNQGQQIPQIAETLNLTVSAVNNYLGITGSSGS